MKLYGGPKGTRTPVNGLKTRCPKPLDDGTVLQTTFIVMKK